jgi:hypothetical protein
VPYWPRCAVPPPRNYASGSGLPLGQRGVPSGSNPRRRQAHTRHRPVSFTGSAVHKQGVTGELAVNAGGAFAQRRVARIGLRSPGARRFSIQPQGNSQRRWKWNAQRFAPSALRRRPAPPSGYACASAAQFGLCGSSSSLVDRHPPTKGSTRLRIRRKGISREQHNRLRIVLAGAAHGLRKKWPQELCVN